MLYRFHYISVFTKASTADTDSDIMCVCNQLLVEEVPMQIFCQHVFVYIKTQMLTLYSF